jgi:hypothetical protein
MGHNVGKLGESYRELITEDTLSRHMKELKFPLKRHKRFDLNCLNKILTTDGRTTHSTRLIAGPARVIHVLEN